MAEENAQVSDLMGESAGVSGQNPIDIEFEAPQERSATKKALAALLIIVVLLVAVGAGAFAWISSKLNSVQTLADPFSGISKIEDVPERPAQPEDDTPPVNFLVLGSDSRVSAGDPSQWEAGAQRTDAFMIAQISGDRKSVSVMSIPRDSWVAIPGHGEAKINSAFSYGGPTLTIATVEQLTGIHIDHVAVVDFTSFAELTDALGGVELTSETEGTRTYTGEEALAFVRERKSLPGGDFDRVRRQQLWMKAVLEKTLTAETLSDPAKLLSLYNSISPYIALDNGLGITDIISLATSMKDVRSKDFNFVTAPFTGTGTSADGQSIVLLDDAKFAELTKAFVEDRARLYIDEHVNDLRTLDSGAVN